MSCNDETADRRLDEINTRWSLFGAVAAAQDSDAEAARRALALRYNRAIRDYVGALVRNDHLADELAQEVLVKLLAGKFDGATPQRGRFRDLLKVSVKNAVRSRWTADARRRTRQPLEEAEWPDEEAPAEPDLWEDCWRDNLLQNAWRSLESFERQHPDSVGYRLLRLRADDPDADTAALARRLAETTGRELRPDAVRQQLRRARLRFAQLLVEETAAALGDPTPERVEDELIAVGLHAYVKDFVGDAWRTAGALG